MNAEVLAAVKMEAGKIPGNRHMKELSPEFLHEMIEKIVVHAPDKSNGKRTKQVDIHYSFGIRLLALDDAPTTIQTGRKIHEKTA